MFGIDFGSVAKGVMEGLIGPAFTYLNKKQDVTLEKYKVDGQVNVQAMREDTEIIKARADLAKAMKDDPTTKYGRVFFIYPVGVWFALIVLDSILHRLFNYSYRVEALPHNLDYIPYAIIAYLFVSAWKK